MFSRRERKIRREDRDPDFLDRINGINRIRYARRAFAFYPVNPVYLVKTSLSSLRFVRELWAHRTGRHSEEVRALLVVASRWQ
jgi:hypothetical protein